MRCLFLSLVSSLLMGSWCSGQTTQGMITGRVRDQLSGAPIAQAVIEYEQLEASTHGTSFSNSDGDYYIPLLPPGTYHVRVSGPADQYQAREAYNIALPVAGYSHINFDLRPLSDVWEKGRYGSVVFQNNTVASYFGPDVDPSYVGVFEPARTRTGQLEPSISEVINPQAIATLPLAGRDVYTALVLQPGIAADNTTVRSLGLSANGQRVTSSNFLLDGVEQNDLLLSGPAVQLAPEMVQEYRVSTNNFSAEYGRTAGYIANAVTRSAVSRWHGIVYGDLNNSVLNANSFEHNANGLPRNSLHQIEGGFSAGGAVPRTKLLTWTALDYFGSRSFADQQIYLLPTRNFVAGLPQSSRARQLLDAYPPGQWADSSFGDVGPVVFTPPVTFRRTTGLERLDYSFSEKQRFMARIVGATNTRPDFNWSPYGQAPFSQSSFGVAAALASRWSPSVVSEIRGSILSASRNWDLALADLPRLDRGALELPGHCCNVGQADEGWRDQTRTVELSANLVLTKGPHLLKVGAGILNVRPDARFVIPAINSFSFEKLADFAADAPYQFDSLLSRVGLKKGMYQTPDTNRSYRYNQPYAFFQEDWQISPRLTLNAGLRYDRFPAPRNIGSVADVLVMPGAGITFNEQIAAASVAEHRGDLFIAYPNNWSVRLAFSLSFWPRRGTILRGGYGTFFDRSYDNFSLTAMANDFESRSFLSGSCALQPFFRSGTYTELPAACPSYAGNETLFDLTLFQAGLRAPRIQSFFLSLQQPWGRNLVFELNGAGSHGKNLLTTDVVNRILPAKNDLPNIDYRTNQGFSDYTALSTTVRYRSGPVTLSTAYTWSHSIDNQSDPLLGEYFDLGFSNQTDRINKRYYGAFTFVGNNLTDRGNSDFDQRQNFVGWTTVALPSPHPGPLTPLLRNWSAAAVFALRSGLPYSVFAGVTNCFPVCNTRANLINPAEANVSMNVPGGVQLLNPAAFSAPQANQTGNTGRNAFRGPGFSNVDFSLSRSFAVRRWGEQVRITIRADIFNLLNHTNLQNPEAYWGYLARDGSTNINSDFGVALYGRAGKKTGFPVSTPLIESPRQLHVLLRLQF